MGKHRSRQLPPHRQPLRRVHAPPVAPTSTPRTAAPGWMDAFEHIEEPVFIHDREFRILRCNPAYAACAALPRAEIVGKPYWQVFPRMPGPFTGCRHALEQGSWEETTEFTTEAGEVFVTHDIMAYDDMGIFLYSRHMMEDITEHRRTDQALQLLNTELKQIENDLRREKLFSDSVIESAPGAFYVIDEQANLVRWNSHLQSETGLTDAQLRGHSVLTAIYAEDRPLAAAKMLGAFATGYAQMEVRVSTNRGVRVYFKTARRFFIDGAPYLAGFGVDITERKLAEETLAREKAFSDALIESVPGAFYAIDAEGNYFRWNSYLNRLTGLSDQQLRQTTSLLTIHEDDRPLAAATMHTAFDLGYAQAELRMLTHDRGIRTFFMTARRFRVADALYLVGVGIDTTDRVVKTPQLEREARTDPLTGVANRSHFLAVAAQEFARSRRYDRPLSLWMVDIDRFKDVNDSYGHQAGDIVLQTLASTSRQALRDWDITGRIGGEEFAVLLPETDTNQALLVAERLRQAVAATAIRVDAATTLHITVSIGIATQRDEDATFEALLDRADHALYEAKRTGRDKVSVSEVFPPRPTTAQ